MTVDYTAIETPEHDELLALLLAEAGIDAPPEQALARVENGRERRASFAQERMWVMDQIEPGQSTYNIPWVVRLSGVVDRDALERSLNEIVRRHESLRTTFVAAEDGVGLVIAPSLTLTLTEVDLSSVAEADREAEALRLAAEETQRPFDLARGPLMRASLFRLSSTEWIFVVTIHHIVSDGWSMGILYRELSALYAAYSNGDASPLEEPARQYSDYAAWQRDWLLNGELDRQLSYWKQKLQGAPPELALPVDHQRSAVESSRGASIAFDLPARIRDELNALSLRENSTLFMTLLAAFNVLLYRYSRQEDICVGSIAAGRVRPEIEDVIGLFINTLVLRTDMSGEPTFVELLARVRELTLETLARQDLPFDKLVHEMQAARDLSSTALFQAMFILQNTHSEELSLAGLKHEEITLPRVNAMFALTLDMEETTRGLRGTLVYRTDLFERATIERLVGHFETLLESIVSDPQQRISALPLLSGAERRQLIEEFNDTQEPYRQDLCLHQLFEAQAAKTPDAVALVFGEERLSYEELNARANQLAHYLRDQGVGPEVLVGIFLDRGIEMVVAVLGILKAGGAYVPLDRGYPKERIEFMLDDAGVKVLVTEETFKSIEGEDVENVPNETTSSNLAYLIYTSGSTGQPKGVQITQRSAQAFIAWSLAHCERAHLDHVLFSTSICFDLSIYELFVPLSCGGAVVLVENALQVAQLDDALEVTLINTVPSAIAELLRLRAIPGSVRRVNLAGEPLPKTVVEQLYELPGMEEVWNLYGPSEDTTYSTAAIQPRGLQRVTIGRPISNTQAYILDQHMRPTPIGVAGELYLGGAGLARGYYRRPQLTAERFIPDPFATTPGGRLYRTGDLVRYLPDGEIEFLGRVDHQVKLRGYRIELGEIQAVLRAYSQVSEAVVLAENGPSGPERLIAYVARQPDTAVTSAELREYLKTKLPAYMVPAAFVLLEQLPLTANGKIDRRALAAMDVDHGDGEEYVGPRTPEEETLTHIWREVLGVAQVGVHDNFFERGGQSLLATRLVSRVSAVCGKNLTVRNVFEAPTIAGQATLLVDQHQNGQPTTIQRRKQGTAQENGTDRLPLSYAQQRLWLLEQLEPGDPTYNLPVAFRLQGGLNEVALRWGLNEIVKRHEVLRTTFVTIDGQPEQVIAPSLTLTVPVVKLAQPTLAEREAEANRLFVEESRHSFDLACGPLVRAMLIDLGDEEHVLVLNMHHIVSDGWSIGILMRELTAFYKAFIEGELVALPELPVQYGDFGVWQRRWLEGDVSEQQLSYWKRKLAGRLPVLELPADNQRPPVQTHEGERQTFVLSKELSAAVKDLSQRQGATAFMTLLAVFKILLHRLTGLDDIAVGSPIAGRNRAETENLIGFFINTLVLRTDLSGRPDFLELLRRVRETALGAYNNQDVPFEHLLEALQPERNVSHTPLFQVFFNMLNFDDDAIELPGLTITALPTANVQAKFDLTLYVEEEIDRFKFSLVYNSSLFSRERIAEMIEQLLQLISDVVARPEESIDGLSLITPAAQSVLPDPLRPIRPTWKGSVHAHFIEQARRVPEQLAIVDGNETWTYQELDARSNQLADYLLAHGIEREDVVAVYAQRSASLILALLGIAKAGAAFVILDPAYPPARLLGYLEAAQPKGVIWIDEAGAPHETLQEYASTLAFDLELGPGSKTIDGYSIVEANVVVRPEDTAYVAFTSGSTGKPKTVIGTHGSLAYFATWASATFHIGETDRFSMLSGLSHDPFHRDAFAPLQLGATICIPDPDDLRNPARLAAWMSEQKITVANLTPAMGQLLGQSLLEEQALQLPALRHAFFVGDVLTRRDAAKLRTLAPTTEIINLYGTTETSRALSYYIVPREENSSSAAEESLYLDKEILPLGQGISEVQLLVMNDTGKQAGVGELGEIYLRSPHLAKGYLGDEQLTREKFPANPFTHDAHDRLYKTGDLGRYLPDGNVEPLGRADKQVQIRGFRIELGEVEAHLEKHTAVSECAVVAREDVPGEKRLVAYVVPAGADLADTGELRSYLKNELPDYMVPGAFVMLDQLPLTPNGKLDRRSLPAPAHIRNESDRESLSEVETVLAEIWCDLIGIESVGVHDNFFELGGHSLLATQLIFRVRKAFRVEVPLFELFKEPTIASLGNIVETLREALPPVADSDESPPAGTILSYAQQRLWFLDTLDPGTTAHNEAMALRLIGELDVQALQRSLDEVIRRHDVLRATFASEDGQAVQTIVGDVSLDLPLHDLTHMPPASREAEAKQLIVNAAKQPFDLSRGPLLRTLLVRLNEHEQVLGLVTHHIVCDAASHSVFVRELIELYDAFRLSQPPVLPELSMQYADFAQSQREWVKTDGVNTHLPYWKERLMPLKSVPELVPDKPRPAVRTYNGARYVLTMSSQAPTDSSFATILTALNVLLHHYTGSDNIVVGTDCSGRDSVDAENLIGPFTNQLVLSTNVAGDPTFNELYDRVLETLTEAQAHQQLPFEEVVEALKPPRDRARTPLFQIKIIPSQPVIEEREAASLRITPLEIHSVTARFDLTILVEKSRLTFEYNTDLFEPSRIASIARCLDAILKTVASDADVRLSNLSDLITETQRKDQDARQTQLKTNVSQQLRNLKRRTTLAGATGKM